MKKVIIMLILMFASVSQATWFSEDEPEKVKPEIKVGQIWHDPRFGDKREILMVGETFIVYTYAEGSYDSPSIRSKDDWYKRFELVEDVEEDDCIIISGDECVFTMPEEPKKPYLHKNPNTDHWICSKHGDLMPDYNKDSMFIYLSYDSTITFYGSKIYCMKCFTETFDKIFGEHITGVDNEN